MAMLGGWRLTRAGILFVIGIIVLAGLVTAGVLIVRNRGEQARRDEAVKVAQQKLTDQADNPSSAPSGNRSDNRDADQTSTGSTSAPSTGQSSSTTASTTSSSTNTASALPETGPTGVDIVGGSIATAALSASMAYYLSSRRTVRRLTQCLR